VIATTLEPVLRTSEPRRPRFLPAYAKLTAFCAYVLLFAGALVTSTGSSLSVPDWPLSFGTVFPPMLGGVLFEHGHRVIAGCVALLTFGLAWALRRFDDRPWARALGYAAA
jgi:heme a synthase